MVKQIGGQIGGAAANAAKTATQAGGGDLQGVIFSALDLIQPNAQKAQGGGLFDAETLNKIIVLIDKLTTLTGNIYRLGDKMKQKANEETINAQFTEKPQFDAIEAGQTSPVFQEATPETNAGIQAAAEAIRKLSEENTILRYRLQQNQLSAEKIDQYLDLVSMIIPEDMPFKEVKQKIRDNLPLIMKFAGGNDGK